MGHPAKMKAITAGKKKSDSIDARMIADLLRCNLLPACYVLPPHLRDLRRLLRYRQLIVRQSVRMQNRMAGLLMESGTPFDRERLHRKKYFADVMTSLREVPESVKDLLRMSRGSMEMFESTQKQLIKRLLCDPVLEQRLERLMSIDGVGPITALTWALEVADPHRFSSVADAVSSQSFHPALPSHTTWELCVKPRCRATSTRSRLRHSSIKNLSTHSSSYRGVAQPCFRNCHFDTIRVGGALRPSPGRDCFGVKRGEFDLPFLQAWIGLEDSLYGSS